MLHNARTLKELLVDIVSKRGVLLLNIAIRPDGTIPQDQFIVMDELGKWIEGNGEAIFDTQPWKIFGEGGITTGGHFKERRISSTPWDFNVYRFTRDKNNKILYIHIFGDPAGKEIIINSLAEKAGFFTTSITKVTVIGNTAPVKWTNHENGLTIFMPDKLEYNDCNVIRVETTGL
jgi:alpha-L-fucosidase